MIPICCIKINILTFYSIYIKTNNVDFLFGNKYDLHSTLFVLKLIAGNSGGGKSFLFTFYFIYIKTER